MDCSDNMEEVTPCMMEVRTQMANPYLAKDERVTYRASSQTGVHDADHPHLG